MTNRQLGAAHVDEHVLRERAWWSEEAGVKNARADAFYARIFGVIYSGQFASMNGIV